MGNDEANFRGDAPPMLGRVSESTYGTQLLLMTASSA